MIEKSDRPSRFAGQNAGIGVDGLMEKLSTGPLRDSRNSWSGKLLYGIADQRPAPPNAGTRKETKMNLAVYAKAVVAFVQETKMNLAVYAKAVVAFVLTVATNLVANLVNAHALMPSTVGAWVTLVVSTAVTTYGVYQWPNKPASKTKVV